MTLFANWYATEPKIGDSLMFTTQFIATASAPEYPFAGGDSRARLGEPAEGIGGSEWMLVQASTTVTAFNVVAIDNVFKANNATSLLAASQVYSYGIAHFKSTLADGGTSGNGDYFWALMIARGGFTVTINPSATRGAALYISTTVPGALTASATVFQMQNIVIVTAAGSSAGVTAEFVMVGYMKTTASI
jgi:hypothetical protein